MAALVEESGVVLVLAIEGIVASVVDRIRLGTRVSNARPAASINETYLEVALGIGRGHRVTTNVTNMVAGNDNGGDASNGGRSRSNKSDKMHCEGSEGMKDGGC